MQYRIPVQYTLYSTLILTHNMHADTHRHTHAHVLANSHRSTWAANGDLNNGILGESHVSQQLCKQTH